MNSSPSGWYPDPKGPPGQERWWDGDTGDWGEQTRQATTAQAPPRRGFRVGGSRRSWVLLAVAGIAAALWLSGSLDEPLSSVGLNKETCAENLFGNKMCGDELLSFCEGHYDKQVNGDVCETVLSDNGEDPRQVAADLKRQEQADLDSIDDTTTAEPVPQDTEVSVGDSADDDGITFRVRAINTAPDGLPKVDGGTVRARRGEQLIVVTLSFENGTNKPIDLGCSIFAGSDGIRLLDTSDREFTPDDSGFEIAGNEDACGDGIQPGLRGKALVPFRIPVDAELGGVRVWNPDADTPSDGGTSLVFH
jgi:hypothetical protein